MMSMGTQESSFAPGQIYPTLLLTVSPYDFNPPITFLNRFDPGSPFQPVADFTSRLQVNSMRLFKNQGVLH